MSTDRIGFSFHRRQRSLHILLVFRHFPSTMTGFCNFSFTHSRIFMSPYLTLSPSISLVSILHIYPVVPLSRLTSLSPLPNSSVLLVTSVYDSYVQPPPIRLIRIANFSSTHTPIPGNLIFFLVVPFPVNSFILNICSNPSRFGR